MSQRYFDSNFEAGAALAISIFVLAFAYGFGYLNGLTHPIR